MCILLWMRSILLWMWSYQNTQRMNLFVLFFRDAIYVYFTVDEELSKHTKGGFVVRCCSSLQNICLAMEIVSFVGGV